MKTILIVGASNNPDKFGYKIVENLLKKGFNVIPINPKETLILGQVAYPNLTSFVTQNPHIKIDWVDLVVPPEVALKVLLELKQLGLAKAWFQPGSESTSAIDFCEKNGIKYMKNKCIMKDY
ncbi:MAG: CoA-binding protein [archaeon]|jgi:hypothetical protein